MEKRIISIVAMLIFLAVAPQEARSQGEGINSQTTPLKAALAILAIKKGVPVSGLASFYTVASCKREKTSGIMANGKPLEDGGLTCALWGVPFGTKVKVTRQETGQSVILTCTDRGPAKRLITEQGRIVDLTAYAFSLLGDLKEGLIPVTVERI